MATREERIQDILNYIRFDMPGIKKIIRENEDVFEEDSGENIFEEDRNNWNEDYIVRNLTWLRKNFSKKRLNHLIEVRDYVRGPIIERVNEWRSDKYEENRLEVIITNQKKLEKRIKSLEDYMLHILRKLNDIS